MEETFDYAKEFYQNIHYYGPYQISIDATAVIPTLRIQENIVYGLAVEGSIKVHSAQDIIDLLAKKHEKTKLGKSYPLVSSCTRYPPFIFSIQPALKGEDNKTVLV